jgi:hypothetical protein
MNPQREPDSSIPLESGEDQAHMPRKKIDLKKVLESLTTVCPSRAFSIPSGQVGAN